MNGALDKLDINRAFAPDAAPGAFGMIQQRLLEAFPAQELSLIVVGILAPLGLLILIQAQLPRRRRGSAPPRRARRRKREPDDVDLAALRQARMPALPVGEEEEQA